MANYEKEKSHNFKHIGENIRESDVETILDDDGVMKALTQKSGFAHINGADVPIVFGNDGNIDSVTLVSNPNNTTTITVTYIDGTPTASATLEGAETPMGAYVKSVELHPENNTVLFNEILDDGTPNVVTATLGSGYTNQNLSIDYTSNGWEHYYYLNGVSHHDIINPAVILDNSGITWAVGDTITFFEPDDGVNNSDTIFATIDGKLWQMNINKTMNSSFVISELVFAEATEIKTGGLPTGGVAYQTLRLDANDNPHWADVREVSDPTGVTNGEVLTAENGWYSWQPASGGGTGTVVASADGVVTATPATTGITTIKQIPQKYTEFLGLQVIPDTTNNEQGAVRLGVSGNDYNVNMITIGDTNYNGGEGVKISAGPDDMSSILVNKYSVEINTQTGGEVFYVGDDGLTQLGGNMGVTFNGFNGNTLKVSNLSQLANPITFTIPSNTITNGQYGVTFDGTTSTKTATLTPITTPADSMEAIRYSFNAESIADLTTYINQAVGTSYTAFTLNYPTQDASGNVTWSAISTFTGDIVVLFDKSTGVVTSMVLEPTSSANIAMSGTYTPANHTSTTTTWDGYAQNNFAISAGTPNNAITTWTGTGDQSGVSITGHMIEGAANIHIADNGDGLLWTGLFQVGVTIATTIPVGNIPTTTRTELVTFYNINSSTGLINSSMTMRVNVTTSVAGGVLNVHLSTPDVALAPVGWSTDFVADFTTVI